jgi:hypothetical protein
VDGTDGASTGGWSHRPGPVLAVAVAVVAALLAVGLFVRAWNDRGARAASVDRTVEGFREGSTGSSAAALLVPAVGVYTYDAQGSERLSLLGTTQAWGDPMPATVTRDERGCWTLRIDLSTNHLQSATYCPAGRVLEEVAGSTRQTFDFVAASVTDVTEFTCDPPSTLLRLDARVGESWRSACAGRSPERGTAVTSAGPTTYLGRQRVRIGSTDVDALHYRIERTLSGDQRGTERTEAWFHPDTGLLLQEVRNVQVASPSPLGDVNYTEQGRFQLHSLTPRT